MFLIWAVPAVMAILALGLEDWLLSTFLTDSSRVGNSDAMVFALVVAFMAIAAMIRKSLAWDATSLAVSVLAIGLAVFEVYLAFKDDSKRGRGTWHHGK